MTAHAVAEENHPLTLTHARAREKAYTCDSPESASIIFTAMEVEKEVRENTVSRDMRLDGASINVTFRSVDESNLNSSVNAFEKSFEFAKEIYRELG